MLLVDAGGQLFFWFITTIFVCRAVLFVKPFPSPTIRGFRMHHWMYGAAGIPLALLIHSLPLFAISLGFFIDELALIIVHKRLNKEGSAAYHSAPSFWGTVFFAVVIFILRDYFATYFTYPM